MVKQTVRFVFYLICVMILAVLMPARGAMAADKTIEASMDMFEDKSGYYNYYDAVGQGKVHFVGYQNDPGAGGGDFGSARAALKFDLKDVDSGRTIQTATLKIWVIIRYQYPGTAPVPFVHLWGINSWDDWDENIPAALPAESVLTSLSGNETNITQGAWMTFNVTAYINNRSYAANASDTIATFVLSGLLTGTPDIQSQISISDHTEAGKAACLEITYLPNSPAVVSTGEVADITSTSATGIGNITNLGSPNPTAHGVCWNTTANPVVTDSHTDQGAASATGQFSSSITGLNPNTTYHVRAYATNTSGTVYGQDVTFTTGGIMPTVVTGSVTAITASTATGSGTITDLGIPNPTQYGVCWSTSAGPDINDNKTEQGGASATGNFTSNITGLTPNTLYYVRAYATNTAGTAYGGEIGFTSSAIPPTASSAAASVLSSSGATLNGTVNANNASSTVSFEYGTTTSYGSAATAAQSPVSGTTDTAVSADITGLSAYTTYHFRVKAVNVGGTSNGDDLTFTTSAVAPTVTTQEVGAITANTATGNGTITDLGVPNPTQHGICWSTSAGPDINDNKTEQGAAGAAGAFTSSITGLSSNTTYYVRAYATNTAGTVYGGEVSFTTLALPPVVAAQAASALSSSGATLNGTVNANNASSIVTFEYGTTISYGSQAAAVQSPVTGAANTSVSAGITGLSAYTTYHFRVKAVNSGGTSYSDDLTFITSAVAPTVTTQEAGAITANTATGNGTITDLGVPNPNQHGVCWSSSSGPDINDNKTIQGAADTAGAFTSSITGLSPNTTYYVRAYATNAAGTVYGGEISFTTLALPPVVAAQAASTLSSSGATLNGTVNANNASSAVSFEYGTTTSYGAEATAVQSPVTGSANTSVSADITGLSAYTTYHFRVKAVNSGGTSYSDDLTFTTSAAAPTVTTQAVTDITTGTATGNGTITDLGVPNPTQYGVCWSISSEPDINDNKTVQGAAGTAGAFTSSITGLSPNTTYYIRAYATNAAGTVYGGELSFTTLPLPPVVAAQAASALSSSGATLNGTVNANNASSTVTFEYGTTTSYGAEATAVQSPVTGSVNTSVSAAITGLSAYTTYHFRVKAVNSGGTNYSDDLTFTTSAAASTVTTQEVAAITVNTATGNGTITDLGVPNPTQHGVCWSSSAGPDINDNKTEQGAAGAVGAFTSSLTGLSPNTTYYVRAYATNAAGTVYGGEVSFTTLALPPVVVTQAASALSSSGATLNGTVNANNASSTVSFEYGTTTSYGAEATAMQSPVTGSVNTSVSADITGLSAYTTYHFRVKAVNSGGTNYGDDLTFATSAIAPTVTIQTESMVTPTAVTGNGTIEYLGIPNPTQHGFCWSADPNPELSDNKTEMGPAISTGAFSCGITGLTPNSSYYMRAYATNAAGTSYSDNRYFTTAAMAPTVNSQAASAVSSGGAALNGTVNANNASTTVSFEYGTTTAYGTEVSAVPSSVTGLTDMAVSADLTGLSANTTYHFRVKAINDGGTSYGDDLTFTTLPVTPTVTTQAVTGITATTATGNGNITGLGFPNPSQYGVCWSLNSNPEISGTRTQQGQASTTGAFTSSITGLNPHTLYYVRAYATNTAGTAYGEEVSFTTAAQPPTVTTRKANDIESNSANLNGLANANDFSTTVVFEYGLTRAYGTEVRAHPSTVSGTVNTSVKAQINGLFPKTTYHFRVKGTSIGGTSYGEDQTFTTKKKSNHSSNSSGGPASQGSEINSGEDTTNPQDSDNLQPAPASGELSDINGHWAEAVIRKMVATGVVKGYADGNFKADLPITRAEFTVMLVKALQLQSKSSTVFKDSIGHWAQAEISTAVANGLVNGYSADRFGPDDPISREQMAIIIVKAAKLEKTQTGKKFGDDSQISSWAREYVNSAVANQILNGYEDNTFRPKNKATRAEAVMVISKILKN